MRESIGGTMLFWIVLFFMSIFIAFMASVINYARVYKIKNSMINYIEKSEGIRTKEEFEDMLVSLGYSTDGDYKVCRTISRETGGFYSLSLYAVFELPFVGSGIRVEIKGETRQIESGTLIKDSGTNQGNWFIGSIVPGTTMCFTSSD